MPGAEAQPRARSSSSAADDPCHGPRQTPVSAVAVRECGQRLPCRRGKVCPDVAVCEESLGWELKFGSRYRERSSLPTKLTVERGDLLTDAHAGG